MRDKGLVVSARGDLAEVQVECVAVSCQGCSARRLCTGNREKAGILSVRNPLHARIGDKVEIEIPEEKYSRALILFFGFLLLALLLGTAAGYGISILFTLDSEKSAIGGILLSLFLAGVFLSRYFRKKMSPHLYPVIIRILPELNSKR